MRAGTGVAVLPAGFALLALTGCGGSDGPDTAAFVEDVFIGSGSTGPFDTRFAPILEDGAHAVVDGEAVTIAKALTVQLDEVEQQEGIDFDVYREVGRIVFRRVVPPTATVRVLYYYPVGRAGETP
jgi:hypothetical protein